MLTFQGKAGALLIASAAAVGSLAMASPASATSAGTGSAAVQAPEAKSTAALVKCSKAHTIRISKGYLTYVECWKKSGSARYTKVDGRVDDTKADGKCVYGKIRIGGHVQNEKDCGAGYNNFHTGWKRGSDAKVTLS